MISMFGRGFDSRQLHDQAQNKHPLQWGFLFSGKPLKTCFQKGSRETKGPCDSMAFVLNFQDNNQCITKGTPQ